MAMSRTVCLGLLLIVAGCGQRTPTRIDTTKKSDPPSPDSARVEKPGIHNVYRVTDKLLSGSSPEGDEGFRSLQELGVKTVITVDGGRPDVERARKFGLRYVHLPFGYDGIPRQRILELARAVRDLPGPIYLHCHHGKHRAPAAAAAVHRCLDDRCTAEQALAELKRAGTDPHYLGLFKTARELTRPTDEELNRASADFPETAKIPDLARSMVEIDTRWDNLKLIRAAGWKTPADHADLDPAHEALQLLEQYREARRLKPRSDEMQRWLADAEGQAEALLHALRKDNKAGTEKAFSSVGASCTRCHARYRDVPQEK